MIELAKADAKKAEQVAETERQGSQPTGGIQEMEPGGGKSPIVHRFWTNDTSIGWMYVVSHKFQIFSSSTEYCCVEKTLLDTVDGGP